MSTSGPASVASDTFDATLPYGLHPQLALRPERFGALAYHYGNRRLTFLKSPQLTAIVEASATTSADAALTPTASASRNGRRSSGRWRGWSSEVIGVR